MIIILCWVIILLTIVVLVYNHNHNIFAGIFSDKKQDKAKAKDNHK